MEEKKESFRTHSIVYITTIILSCIPLFFYSVRFVRWVTLPELLELLFWVTLIFLFEYKPAALFSHSQEEAVITVTSTVVLTVIILFGVQAAILITMLGTLIAELFLKRPLYKALFNTGQYGITVLVSGYLFYIFKQSPDHISINIVSDWFAIFALITSHYLINSILVSLVLSLTTSLSFITVFLYDIKITLIHYATSSILGLSMAKVYDPDFPFVVLLFLPPLFLIDQAIRWYYDLQRAATKTIRALADIIDRRDQYTAEHSTRVTEYASRIATSMKLSDIDITTIGVAASVHDLGKIGIADSIINKESFLNDEEYSQIKKHPEIAYELIKNLKPYEKSAAYVLHHHEWLNGNGYPRGLKNDEIPLGAKIVAVADAFDAMTTHRPYRRAYSTREAIAELKRCSGSQFDPNVADVLITILEKSEDQ